ncbi:MAG: hypothetical protein ACRYG5_05215 [Janthinobacterium lividum]
MKKHLIILFSFAWLALVTGCAQPAGSASGSRGGSITMYGTIDTGVTISR